MKKELLRYILNKIDPTYTFAIMNNGDIIWLDPRPQPTSEDIQKKFEELEKEIRIENKYKITEKYIYQYYPQVKQNSDLTDKLYYENLLKSQGVQNLESDIVQRVQDFYEGKTLDEVLADVPEEHKEAYEQLIKVGIRVAWVQHCKKELKSAIAENREPEFQDYPL